MKNLSLKFRLVTAGIVLVAVPLIVVALFFAFQGKKLSKELRADLVESSYAEMDAKLELLMGEVRSAKHLLEKDVAKVIQDYWKN